MSGHSKWKTNKGKKNLADAKKGATYTKLIKEITVIAREGGGNPDNNSKLRAIMVKAKEAIAATGVRLQLTNNEGIYFYSSNNNTIKNNSAFSNTYGIYLEKSSNNTINHNNFYSNTNQGFYFASNSNNNSIINNTASGRSLTMDFDYTYL